MGKSIFFKHNHLLYKYGKNRIKEFFSMSRDKEKHLDIYEDRYELHQDDETTVYYQGPPNEAAQQRYGLIKRRLDEGFLDDIIESVPIRDFSELSDENKSLLKEMVDGITSEKGRGLVVLTCLQLAIKSISSEQCIRLHKGSSKQGDFSWVDGISMRTLDKNYNTPFLRRYGLLNLNSDGSVMTRTLAENYPYSTLYKAQMRGPFDQWIAIVDAIENETMPPELGLCFLIALLQNRSNIFHEHADKACALTQKFNGSPFDEIYNLISSFFNETDYSARAFEVTMHGFYQAMDEMMLLGDADLVPICQMRSANKKHGNVGDIELAENRIIFEAWDAKYGKPYLRDELEELFDKLLMHPEVRIAGFVSDKDVDMRDDIKKRKEEIEIETGTEIYLFSFDEWICFNVDTLNQNQKDELGFRWLVAIVESFAQKRLDIAPIDEPCDGWINDLIGIMNQWINGEQYE